MERIKLSHNFYLDEVIDPVTYFTEFDNGQSKIDLSLITIVQVLRAKYGKPLPINNWWKYAVDNNINHNSSNAELIAFSDWIDDNRYIHQWSGYRSERCQIGASKSTHKLGQSLDPKGNQKELFNIIRKDPKLFYDLGLRQIEDIKITKGWLHISTSLRNFNEGRIRVIGRYKHAFDLVV